jgi:hypothetical protein
MSDLVEKAVTCVRNRASYRQASLIYGVAKSTVHRHLVNPYLRKIGPGEPTMFGPLKEQTLEDIILLTSEFQIGMTKTEFLRVVGECAREKGLNLSTLSRKWYRNFPRRHPIVSERITQAVNVKKLKEWSMENADQYISLLQTLKDDGYLEDPAGIWNFDESGFKLAVLISKTLTKRGAQYVYTFAQGKYFYTS